MAKFDTLVNKVVKESDIILIVLDARKIKESMNKKIENYIKRFNKKFLYVVNKIDLVSKKEQSKIKLYNSVQVSAKNHTGTLNLFKRLMEIGKGKDMTVGIVGYPNTGKSTLINALKGKHSAPVSNVSGYTRGLQKIRVSQKVLMIDTPGVFSYEKKENVDNIVIGAVDAEKVKDPELAASELIEKLDGKIEEYFEVEKQEDPTDTLEQIAIKKKVIKRGNNPDTARMGKQIIRLWQNGKIR